MAAIAHMPQQHSYTCALLYISMQHQSIDSKLSICTHSKAWLPLIVDELVTVVHPRMQQHNPPSRDEVGMVYCEVCSKHSPWQNKA